MLTSTIKEEGDSKAMKLPQEIGDQAINQVLERHPAIGEILSRYDIGCVTCGVGICLVKDVVSIHALGNEIEASIEREINEYLSHANHVSQPEGEKS
jgi:hypothetical protein